MGDLIRAAGQNDVAGIVALLDADARQRSARHPRLWRWDDRAEARIANGLAAELGKTPRTSVTLVAEAEGRIAGFTRAMVVPVPPIYDPGVTPGLLLDDCCTAPDAPPGTGVALIATTEAALAEAGATSFIASAEAGSAWHQACEENGYETVTLYLAKAGFSKTPVQGVRAAQAEDVPAIVALSAGHRAILQAINERFWRVHPEADQRFGLWMGYSLTLKDRAMLVADGAQGLAGYIIAQPCPAMHMPMAHDADGIGIIDDFHTAGLGSVSEIADAAIADALLAAAESVFAQRGFGAALAICPAGWASKRRLLERHDYQTVKVWMLKRP